MGSWKGGGVEGMNEELEGGGGVERKNWWRRVKEEIGKGRGGRRFESKDWGGVEKKEVKKGFKESKNC